jgi:hypothetical protein
MAERPDPYDKYIKHDGYDYRPNKPSNYHAVPKKKVVYSSAGGKKNVIPVDLMSPWERIKQVWDDFEGQDYEDICDALYSIIQEIVNGPLEGEPF